MAGEPGSAPGSIGGLELRPNVLRGLRAATSIPGLSLTRATLVLVACFVLSAVLFPALLSLPRWIEFELVVAGWWVVWAVALTYLLYTGRGLVDDFRVEHLPRFGRRRAATTAAATSATAAAPPPAPLGPGASVDDLRAAASAATASPAPARTSAVADTPAGVAERPEARSVGDALVDAAGDMLSSVDLSQVELPNVDLPKIAIPSVQVPDLRLPPLELPKFDLPDIDLGGGDSDGAGAIIVGILVALLVAILAGLIIFVAVQFVIPALAIGTYALIRAQIQQVRGQAGALVGDLGGSLLRGVTWATVYTAPFALAVWLGHVLL